MARDVVFEDMEEQAHYTLENQDGSTREVDEAALEDYLEQMFDDPDQFIILTPPAAQNGVRYIQARRQSGGQIEAEIALQAEGGLRLYYKMVSPRECRRLFFDYLDNVFRPDLAEYQLVEFR